MTILRGTAYDGQWITHEGTGCPIPMAMHGTYAIQFRDGTKFLPNWTKAGEWNWQWRGKPMHARDVVAYVRFR